MLLLHRTHFSLCVERGEFSITTNYGFLKETLSIPCLGWNSLEQSYWYYYGINDSENIMQLTQSLEHNPQIVLVQDLQLL